MPPETVRHILEGRFTKAETINQQTALDIIDSAGTWFSTPYLFVTSQRLTYGNQTGDAACLRVRCEDFDVLIKGRNLERLGYEIRDKRQPLIQPGGNIASVEIIEARRQPAYDLPH